MKIVTMLTDFGLSDSYVAQMKGVILSQHPDATIVDITHQVPPQDILYASRSLANTWSYFPKGTIHMVIVDPAVGTKRERLQKDLAYQIGFKDSVNKKLSNEKFVANANAIVIEKATRHLAYL